MCLMNRVSGKKVSDEGFSPGGNSIRSKDKKKNFGNICSIKGTRN